MASEEKRYTKTEDGKLLTLYGHPDLRSDAELSGTYCPMTAGECVGAKCMFWRSTGMHKEERQTNLDASAPSGGWTHSYGTGGDGALAKGWYRFVSRGFCGYAGPLQPIQDKPRGW